LFDWVELGKNTVKGVLGGGVGASIGKFGSLLYRPTLGGVLGSPLRYSPASNYGAHGAAAGAVVS